MVTPRNHFADPAARFVADFTRLIRDVDRLMVDLRSSTESERVLTPGKTNGQAPKPTLNGAISTLREHARSFVKSLRYIESDRSRNFENHRVRVPYMELDWKARILGTNQECAEMLNGSGVPLRGKSLFTFVADSDIKRLQEQLALVRQTTNPRAVRLRFVKKGKSYPVELRIRRESIGKEIGYIATVDRADQIETVDNPSSISGESGAALNELLLQLSRAQTLKSTSELVVSYCGKVFGSPSAMIFVENGADLQLISEFPGRISKKRAAEEMIKNGPVARAFRAGKLMSWRLRREPRSNGYRYLCRLLGRSRCRDVHFLPISAPGQRPIGVLAVVLPHQDEFSAEMRKDLLRLRESISGFIVRARAYDEALAARVRAENAVQKKDEFLSVLSHELKNPMMPILGWAVALSSGTLPADKQNHALDGIVRNVRTMNYLIEDLFDVSRITSGKLRLQREEVRIQEVAREALTAIQYVAESKKLRISTDISEAIPPFSADPRRLRQVLINLLNNAVKFTQGGGSINLKVFRRGENVECIVSDTGKGIEPKFLPFVFERFAQENRRLKAVSGGLGLGLAIVREIVERHGGTITAYSEGIDRGATFILRLPIRRRDARS
jgi:signal transduction histidine kinase